MQTHIRSTFDSDKTNSDAWVTEGVTRSTALRPASALPSPPSPGAASRTRHRGLRVRPEVYVSGYTSPYAGPPFRDTWPAAGAGPSYVAPPLRPAPPPSASGAGFEVHPHVCGPARGRGHPVSRSHRSLSRG